MIGSRFFLVYDCRDYQSEYLGRILLVYGSIADFISEPSFAEIRSCLDSHSVLRRACSWRVKEIDSSLIMDFCEEL